MMRHTTVRRSLYDFLMNELRDDERRLVQQHLDECAACKRELHQLERTIELLSPTASNPAAVRDDVFWDELAGNVEQQIARTDTLAPGIVQRIVGRFRAFVTLRPAYAYATGASFAVLLLAAFLFLWKPVPEEGSLTNAVPASDGSLVQEDPAERMREYFRKSRTLLVGLVNMKTGPSAPLELSAEQQLSRALVHEARYLKQHMLDSRSAKLVNDMEKILIELANLETANNLPNVELIRSGIAQENLLFKIRMAEAMFDTAAGGTNDEVY